MPSDSHSLIMSTRITPWVEIRSLAGSDSDSNDSDTRSKNAPTLCLRFPESSFSYIPSGQFIRGKIGGQIPPLLGECRVVARCPPCITTANRLGWWFEIDEFCKHRVDGQGHGVWKRHSTGEVPLGRIGIRIRTQIVHVNEAVRIRATPTERVGNPADDGNVPAED